MSRTVTLEVSSAAQESLIRQVHSFLMEMDSLALQAPDGQVLDLLEIAAVEGGRNLIRTTLEAAVQQRIDDAEKKAPDCEFAPAGEPVRTGARPRGR
jgi:hypothetical protein